MLIVPPGAGVFESAFTLAANAVADSAILTLHGPTVGFTRVLGVTKLSLYLRQAARTDVALYRLLAAGTATTSVNGISIGGQAGPPTSQGVVDSTWSVAPTKAGNPIRSASMGAAIGNKIDWEWPDDEPLIIGTAPLTFGICLTNNVFVGSGQMSGFIRWKEW